MKKKDRILLKKVNSKAIPDHIAIIMDGNGRWAKKHMLPRTAGHRKGVEALRNIIETSTELKVKHLTLYAFSTENWKRPKDEVNALMSLLVEFFQSELDELHKNKVKIYMLGCIEGLPDRARYAITEAIDKTNNNDGLQVNIAINYGSRAEIVSAVKSLAQDISEDKLSIEDINEDLISSYLDTGGIPDPDMLIRTSGEYRISNFLLYQIAYTELVFTKGNVFWPDFNRKSLLKAILEYQSRTRKYGGINSGGEN